MTSSHLDATTRQWFSRLAVSRQEVRTRLVLLFLGAVLARRRAMNARKVKM